MERSSMSTSLFCVSESRLVLLRAHQPLCITELQLESRQGQHSEEVFLMIEKDHECKTLTTLSETRRLSNCTLSLLSNESVWFYVEGDGVVSITFTFLRSSTPVFSLIYQTFCDDNINQQPALSFEDTNAKLSIGDQRTGDGNSDAYVPGIPEFWLRIFKNVDILSDMFGEQDEPILRHLKDIRVKLLTEKAPGFLLEFVFDPNDYFTNAVLTKEYTLRMDPDKEDLLSYEGPEIIKSTGCKIDWKEGKNVTLKKVQKTQRRQGQETKRTVTKIVRAHSFFNFFSPPQVPEGEEPDNNTYKLISADYEVGQSLRGLVDPKDIHYSTTGEALEDKADENGKRRHRTGSSAEKVMRLEEPSSMAPI